MNSISEIETPNELLHGLGPIWAATRVANPDFTLCMPITFDGRAGFTATAHTWRSAVFAPILLPALRAALHHGRSGELRELAALDRRLSEELSPQACEGSLRAGRNLAERGCDLRGDRTLPRIAEAIRSEAMPGHLAIVFAARCAVFSLADRVAAGAYLFQEISAGAPHARVTDVCTFVSECIEPLGGSSLELRAA
ncbi:MAG TPA: urease accessory UreF family protein [Chthoniobacterales bacterium]